MQINSKITLDEELVMVRDSSAKEKISSILLSFGCTKDVALQVA